MTEIQFTNDAIDDLRRVGPEVVPRILKKILLLETDPRAGYPLGGELTGFRKLVVGRNTWRVVYRIDGEIIEVCQIWAIGGRAEAEVYSQAAARVRAATRERPSLRSLIEIMEQLGRLTGGIEAAIQSRPEPVPGWLADRLVYTAGLSRPEVAAMDLEQAVDAWAKYTSSA